MVVAPSLKFSQIKNQYYAAISANMVMMGHGCAIGWLSPALPLLQSLETPLISGPLTVAETSWIGSLLSLGAIGGNFIFGYLMNRMGTKRAISILFIPQLISWIAMYTGTISAHLYLVRFMSGIAGGGIQVCLPLYIAEIAHDSIRGKLGTINQLSRNVGVLLAYTLGAYFSYIALPGVYIGISVIFILSSLILPSTPQYLLKTGKEEEAEKSLKFYKGYGDNNDDTCKDEFEQLKLVAKQTKEEESLSIKDLLVPAARKGLIIALALAFLNEMCGSYVFLTYASNIFEISGTNLTPYTSSIILALVEIVGTFSAGQLVDTQGRKFLLILSLSGCTVGLSSMATYLYYDYNGYDVTMFHWVPVTSLAFVILMASLGIMPLTSICLVEVLPRKIRSFGLMAGTTAVNLISFVVGKLFPILTEIIHLYGCMCIFAISCAFGVLFVIFVMSETKGQNLNHLKKEIELTTDTKA